MESKDWVAARISALISVVEYQDGASSHWRYYPLSSENTITIHTKHRNTLGNIGNAVKVIVGTQRARKNVRQWKKAIAT